MTAPALIFVWYDRDVSSWVIQILDENASQIGDAEYHYRKSQARESARQIASEYYFPAVPLFVCSRKCSSIIDPIDVINRHKQGSGICPISISS